MSGDGGQRDCGGAGGSDGPATSDRHSADVNPTQGRHCAAFPPFLLGPLPQSLAAWPSQSSRRPAAFLREAHHNYPHPTAPPVPSPFIAAIVQSTPPAHSRTVAPESWQLRRANNVISLPMGRSAAVPATVGRAAPTPGTRKHS